MNTILINQTNQINHQIYLNYSLECHTPIIHTFLNKINIQSMLLSKSSSLPQIKVNFNKYDNFFTNKNFNNDNPLDQDAQSQHQPNVQKLNIHHQKPHLKNLNFIQRRSSIKSKVQSYLTDSRKMGILDHNNNQTSNRRSLTRISLQAMKTVKTEVEQQKTYLTKLKNQLNSYCQKNQIMEHTIKGTEAMTTQVKQKIIFYNQLLARSWMDKYELLNEREDNIIYIRYESDRLKYMQQRLKEINNIMRKRVKDAQTQLKVSENQAQMLNQVEGIKQAELDKRQYLLRHYEQFQEHKTEILGFKTDQASKKMEVNQAAEILKRHQSSITIMEQQDYILDTIEQSQKKYLKDILIQKCCKKILDSMWTKYSSYYESYEKAEQLIKMHCMDRTFLVQDSYKRSFQVKAELQASVKQKEVELKRLQERNQILKKQYTLQHFGQIEDMEKRLNQIKDEYKTGKEQIKNAEQKSKRDYQQGICLRMQEVERAKQMMIRLKEWILKQQKTLQSYISKKQSLSAHFTSMINFFHTELKKLEPTYELSLLKPAVKNPVTKPSKNGTHKKKK